MTKWLVSEIIGSVQVFKKSRLQWIECILHSNCIHKSMTGDIATRRQWCYFGDFFIFLSVTNIDATLQQKVKTKATTVMLVATICELLF